MDGHRLGDFPHQVYYRGSMQEVEEYLLPNLWVMELKLIDPVRSRAFFFEDILRF
jgi:hypothetical protein